MLGKINPEVECISKSKEGSGSRLNNTSICEYIDHVEKGVSLREIAKRDGVHPSTVMRRIRKLEDRRDDPLLDDALTRICEQTLPISKRKEVTMNISIHKSNDDTDPTTNKDILRILRRMSENNAFMVMSLGTVKSRSNARIR